MTAEDERAAAKADLLPPELLRRLLAYDPETGNLTWRERAPDVFADGKRHTAAHKAALWNSNYAGTPALASISTAGYRNGAVLSIAVRTHRVVWAMHHGAWPTGDIDHINGDKADNRISNLRDVPRQINLQNRPRQSNNNSGVTGVFEARTGWDAYIYVSGARIDLGHFKEFQAAVAARKSAEARFGFHINHDREGIARA